MSDELLQAFDALKPLRGKARDAALTALLAHGDALLPALAPVLDAEDKGRRELALKVLSKVTPSTKQGREALSSSLARMLGSTKPTVREAALSLVQPLGAEGALVAAPLARMLTFEPKPEAHKQALEKLLALGLEVDALAPLLEPAVDSWCTATRDAVSAQLRAWGRAAPASLWTGCPLADEVVSQVQRLGGRCREAFDPSKPRPASCSWARQSEEKRAGVTFVPPPEQLPPAVHFFDHNLRWERGKKFYPYEGDFKERYVELTAASECYDWVLDGRQRCLYVIGYNELQWYYCLDALSDWNNPPVFGMDHEGWDRGRVFSSLRDFLASLRSP